MQGLFEQVLLEFTLFLLLLLTRLLQLSSLILELFQLFLEFLDCQVAGLQGFVSRAEI
jgi:hypothetical protein